MEENYEPEDWVEVAFNGCPRLYLLTEEQYPACLMRLRFELPQSSIEVRICSLPSPPARPRAGSPLPSSFDCVLKLLTLRHCDDLPFLQDRLLSMPAFEALVRFSTRPSAIPSPSPRLLFRLVAVFIVCSLASYTLIVHVTTRLKHCSRCRDTRCGKRSRATL